MSRARGAPAAWLACALGAAAAGAQTPPRARAQPAAQSEAVDYRVRRGDTCAAIARRLYGDARWTSLIHAGNALGRPPHRLAEGQVLRLPRRAPVRRGAPPDAVLTAAHNRVEVLSPDPRPARGDDPLFRGHRVTTRERSTAEVTFSDETQLRLQEETLVVILGGTSASARRARAAASDTTLVSGALRASLGALAGRGPGATLPIQTPAARVELGAGEAEVRVERGRGTTLAVYRGRSRIRARRRVVTVNAGFAVRAEEGPRAPPLVVRRLPAAVGWSRTPPPVVFTDGTADLAWAFAPGEGAAPASFRVEVARDEWFLDVDGARLAADARDHARAGLAPGRYHARVRAVDAEGFEGPFGPVAVTAVVRPVVAHAARAHRGTLELPAGLYCSLDDAPFTPTGSPPEIDRLVAHRLRCARSPDGRDAAETTIPRERFGPLSAAANLDAADARTSRGVVRVRLRDGAGEPLAGHALAAVGSAGVTASPPEALAEPGLYAVPIAWRRGARAVTLRLTADGEESVETRALALPAPPPPPPPPPPPGFVHRLAVRAEGGAGTMLSDYQRNRDAQRYEGNVRGFDPGYHGTLRLGLSLAGPLAVQASASSWFFPSDLVEVGRAATYTAGARYEPGVGRVGRLFVDANAGLALSGPHARFAFDAGVGFEFALSRAIGLGPVLRYGHILQPDADDFPDDARFWAAGLSLGLRLPAQGVR